MFLSTHEIFRKLDHILRDKSQQFSKNLNNKNSIFSHDIHKKLSNDGGGDTKREEAGWEGAERERGADRQQTNVAKCQLMNLSVFIILTIQATFKTEIFQHKKLGGTYINK